MKICHNALVSQIQNVNETISLAEGTGFPSWITWKPFLRRRPNFYLDSKKGVIEKGLYHCIFRGKHGQGREYLYEAGRNRTFHAG